MRVSTQASETSLPGGGQDQPPAAAVVRLLDERLAASLGEQLAAIYVYGSLVSGGFEPGASDIDLLAVTNVEAGELDLGALEQLHTDVALGLPAWADRVEVVYIGHRTLAGLRRGGRLAVISPGESLHLRDDAERWLQNVYLVRETARIVRGPAPRVLMPRVDSAEFLAAVAQLGRELQANAPRAEAPGARAYILLTLCRTARTLETGLPGSKQEAAAWLAGRRPARAQLIEEALACRRSRGRVGLADEHATAAFHSLVAELWADIRAAAARRGIELPPATPRDEASGRRIRARR